MKGDVDGQIVDGRTLVPLRAILEKAGATITWDGSTQTATIKLNGDTLKISIGKSYLTFNGVQKAIDVPAQLIDNRTMVPVRAISEQFGMSVGWIDEYKTVILNSDVDFHLIP